jgi:hypothetical protein
MTQEKIETLKIIMTNSSRFSLELIKESSSSLLVTTQPIVIENFQINKNYKGPHYSTSNRPILY